MKKLERAMEKLRKGDNSAFETIYDLTHRLVYYVVYRVLRNEEESKEITQEVYMRVVRSINTYKSDNAQAWITTIAKNLAINEYNRKKRKPQYNIEDLSLVKDPAEVKDTPTIDLAMEILTEEEYLIVMLATTQNYTRKKLGEMFNLSTSGVTYKLNEALNKLKEALI